MKKDLYNIGRIIATFGVLGGIASNLQATTLALEVPWLSMILGGVLFCTVLELSSPRFVRQLHSIALAAASFVVGLIIFGIVVARLENSVNKILLIAAMITSLLCGIWYECSRAKDTRYVGNTLAAFGIIMGGLCLVVMCLSVFIKHF